ncbi:MAG: lysozyme [Bacteroidota bacterium]
MKRFDLLIPFAVLLLGVSAFGFVSRPNEELPRTVMLHTTTDTTELLHNPIPDYIITEYGDSVWSDYTWDHLIERIKRREHFMPKPYRCAAGALTIGYGHTIKPEDRAFIQSLPPEGLTEAQADSILRKDLAYSKWFVEEFLGELEGTQKIALTNFCYAFGTTKLHNSQLFKKIKAGEEAEGEFAKWIHINGRPNSYLAKERAFEWALYTLGKDADDSFALAR